MVFFSKERIKSISYNWVYFNSGFLTGCEKVSFIFNIFTREVQFLLDLHKK